MRRRSAFLCRGLLRNHQTRDRSARGERAYPVQSGVRPRGGRQDGGDWWDCRARSASRRCGGMGRSCAARLLPGSRVCEARFASSDDGRNRFRRAARSGLGYRAMSDPSSLRARRRYRELKSKRPRDHVAAPGFINEDFRKRSLPLCAPGGPTLFGQLQPLTAPDTLLLVGSSALPETLY
jgi:hypothetical protein